MIKKIVFFATLLIASTSLAADYANYPGNMCVRFSGGTVNYWYAGIGNTSTTSDMSVDCSIQKDNHTGNLLSGGWIMTVDQSDNEAVSCNEWLISMMDGASGYYGGSASCGNTGNAYYGTSNKRLDCPALTISSSYDDYAYAYYACTIPNRDINTSYIFSYGVVEE